MANALLNEEIEQKMEDLCRTLLASDTYRELRLMLDRFALDKDAGRQYAQFVQLHQALEQKEAQGAELTGEEMARYEQEERALYASDTIRQFLYAQREFSHLHNWVSAYFTKSVELDRIPEPADLKQSGGCGCGGSCGCGGGH